MVVNVDTGERVKDLDLESFAPGDDEYMLLDSDKGTQRVKVKNVVAGKKLEHVANEDLKNKTDDAGIGVSTEEIQVIGTSIGAIEDGSTIPVGTSINDFLKMASQKRIAPVYIAPTLSMAIDQSGTKEVGESVIVNLSTTYNNNDAGAANRTRYYLGASVIEDQSGLATEKTHALSVAEGSNTYKVVVDYNAGAVKNDNLGDPWPAGQIPAGSLEVNRTLSGAFAHFYGANGNTTPTDGASVRALSKSFSTSFTLNTGATDKVFVIAVPTTKVLDTVIDQDALNANITASFVLSATVTTVPDASGADVNYNVYVMENAVAFPSNHRLLITLKNA